MEQTEPGRLIGALSAPGKTFAAIAERPTWVLALVVLVLLSGLSVWVAFSHVPAEEFARSVQQQMEARGQAMPAGMDTDRLFTVTRWSAVIGALLVSPLVYLAMAAIFLAVFRLAGGTLDFKRSFSVTLHGMLPFGLAALIGIPVAFAKGNLTVEEVQGGGFLMSHLGFLAGEEAGSVLRALLSSVDLFSIWCIALLTIGFAAVAGVRKGVALGGVGAVWALGVAIKLALAALRG